MVVAVQGTRTLKVVCVLYDNAALPCLHAPLTRPYHPRWVADWERLVQMMVDEPYLPSRLDPGTGALQGFLEAPAELQVRGR